MSNRQPFVAHGRKDENFFYPGNFRDALVYPDIGEYAPAHADVARGKNREQAFDPFDDQFFRGVLNRCRGVFA
jgi:hypothetical protein